jgi:rhamnogalacturonyl hydrolase YesR
MNLFLISTLILADLIAPGQSVNDKSDIKELMLSVNRYQLENPWREYDDNWIRGTYYAGVMACYQATGDEQFLEQCNTLGMQLNWDVPKVEPHRQASGVNVLTLGQTWIESYMVDKRDYKIDPIISYLEDPSYKNPVSSPIEWHFEGGRRYVDGLFTGPPALAMLYHVTGDEKYLNWMDAHFWSVYGQLFDNEDNLFYRDIRYKQGYSGIIEERKVRPETIPHEEARFAYVYQISPNGRKVLWSRGNGWAMGGFVRIMKYLPVTYPNYNMYKEGFIRLSNELIERQRPNGFWYPNLDDPEDFGYNEASGTGFFVYGLAWGINNGILRREEFIG